MSAHADLLLSIDDLPDERRSGAIFSDCRRYRYALWREWDATLPQLVLCGLNPSDADESRNDPTIRRGLGFARREGCGKLVMLNMHAFVATKPEDMLAAADPVGPLTDAVLRTYATDPRTLYVVAAWGTHGDPARVATIRTIFPTLMCFGTNKDGSPKHPLYLPKIAPLVPWCPAARPGAHLRD
jgi:hypothetical protein